MEHRIKMLNEIFSNLQQITQWLPNNIDNSAKYMYKAESLIESLEIDDCGSIGGYDKNSPIIRVSGFDLFDRFLALVRKYDNEKDIKECCGYHISNMKLYFEKLSRLRGEIMHQGEDEDLGIFTCPNPDCSSSDVSPTSTTDMLCFECGEHFTY